MQLVERRKLDLDDLAADHLPPSLRFDTNGATIADLLGHRSGILETLLGPGQWKSLTTHPLQAWTIEEESWIRIRIQLGIGQALGDGHAAGVFHESTELRDGDLMLVDQEGIDGHLADRRLLPVEVVGPHEERPAPDGDHVFHVVTFSGAVNPRRPRRDWSRLGAALQPCSAGPRFRSKTTCSTIPVKAYAW
jgi:hypothetical protein